MSFSAAWLDLREPADRAARDPALLAAASAALGPGLALDLGCGTGAMARALPAAARWRLLDRDPDLLRIAATRLPGAALVRADLADPPPLDGVRLVTLSALLDLMPRAWIERLADRLAAARVAAYACLSYDGRIAWSPPLAEDAPVLRAFNRHQRRDKGLGPALGPEAGPAFAAALAARGHVVRTASSPWRLGPDQAPLQAALIEGIAQAATEAGHSAAGWARSRLAAIGSATVGHLDMLALPSTQSKITSLPSP